MAPATTANVVRTMDFVPKIASPIITEANPITNKEQQVTYLKERLEIFLEVLDAIDPETTDLEDIDRLIKMMDDLEEKMEQFQIRDEKA